MNKEYILFDEQSAVQRVEALLNDAIKKHASDIHLEHTPNELRVRFRIDGILVDQKSFSLSLSSSLIVRLKILAHLNIAERRIPQDGKFQQKHNDMLIDIRVSTFPALYGEKMVVRILDRSCQGLTLESLGFEPKIMEQFKRLLMQHNGFFIVTGPTGSGKTTTLYAALSFLNNSQKNIVTLEDPVEYSLEGITQSQVQPAAGFTFERGLRSLVRQDPDIIMIGEIRDKITARIAIEAALTGHFVLSTLHTGHAIGALMRLLDMGIEPFLLNATLSGILAQRLVRKLCMHCRQLRVATTEEKKVLREYDVECDSLYHAEGCDACDGLGYKGRTGIFELLIISSALRALINKNHHYDDLHEQVLRDGMQILLHDGAQKVKDGIISFEEFMRLIA